MSQSLPYWSSHIKPPVIPSLDHAINEDVVVIGAGIAGLTVAYLLLKAGHTVTILTDKEIGGGETSRTTAHLTYMLDDRFYELEKLFSADGLQLALHSHQEAIDVIEKISLQEGIECDFERINSYLFAASRGPRMVLEREYATLKRAHIYEAKLEDSSFPFFKSKKVLIFPRQGQIHPLKYLYGLSRVIKELGGHILKAHVVETGGGKPCFAKTDLGHEIRCGSLVIATNTPINNRFVMHTKQAAYRTYVIAGYIPQHSFPKGLYYDTLDPYHYIRVYSENDRDLLIIGGEDHKTGQAQHPKKAFHKLENWAVKRFPMLKDIQYAWSGQVLEPVDCLGFAGLNPLENHVYIITGDSGNGMTFGTIGAKIVVDMIDEGASTYAKLYDPARKSLFSMPEFAKENLNVGKQYARWLSPFEATHVKKIPKNAGKVFQDRLKKVAIYKDETGALTELSAVCPHLGCIVNWNDAEKTWDCPCHGSRFACTGKVISGPAVENLKALNHTKSDDLTN